MGLATKPALKHWERSCRLLVTCFQLASRRCEDKGGVQLLLQLATQFFVARQVARRAIARAI